MQRLESVTIQHHRSISPRIIVFAATLRGMGISRAQISNPTWHTCLVASQGRGSRVTVPDYQQICGESIASQANRSIDGLIAWLIDEKSACDERVHVENENEPIGRQQGNESLRRRRWRNVCLFVSSRLSGIRSNRTNRRSLFTKTYVSLAFFVSWHASAKKKKKKKHGWAIFRSSREKTIEFCDEENRRNLTRFNDRTDSYSRDIRNC